MKSGGNGKFLNSLFRDLRDFRQRNDALIADLKRKDKQMKELQNRLDSGDGCKYFFHYQNGVLDFFYWEKHCSLLFDFFTFKFLGCGVY